MALHQFEFSITSQSVAYFFIPSIKRVYTVWNLVQLALFESQNHLLVVYTSVSTASRFPPFHAEIGKTRCKFEIYFRFAENEVKFTSSI